MSILNNIEDIRNNIHNIKKKNGEVQLVAVTKMVDIDKAIEVINCGVRDIGENRVQEFLNKYELLKEKVNFHLIGHLQSNKVKYIVGKCKLIHSVDSLKLLSEIEKECKKANKIQEVLIQVNISNEESKYGVSKKEAMTLILENEKNSFTKIKGLMTIAPYTKNVEEIRWVFKELYQLYIDIQPKTFYNTSMEFISMGMSNDYKIAIEEGANIIRIGSSIFK